MPSQAVLELLVNLKDNASSGLASLGNAVGSLGVVAGGVALAGVAALGAAVVSGVGDAREAAKVYAQTQAVIKSTGGAAGVTADQVSDLAASLSAASGQSLFGDDDIQQSTNLLLTFTELKGKVLDAATAMSVDMAQAMGGAPKDAAIQLGKALNDPIKGITALSRVGVAFTEEQKAQIKTMQEAGDMAGAQQVILAELNKEFGGSAAAAAAADDGWAQINDRMGEAAETVGAALLPVLGMLSGFIVTTIVPAIETAAAAFAAWLADPAVQAGIAQLADAISTGLAVAFDFIANTAIPALVGAWALLQPAIAAIIPLFTSDLPTSLQSTGTTFTVLQEVITAVMGAIQAVIGAVLPQIAAFWQANGAEIMAFVQTTWDAIQGIIQTALQIIQAIVVPILGAIAGFINAHGTEIQAILKATWDYISGVITVALNLIQGLLKTILLAINGDWAGAWAMLQKTSAEFVQGIIDTVTKSLGDLEGVFNTVVASIKAIWDGFVTSAAAIGANIVQGIISGVTGAAGSLYSALKDMAGDALQAAKSALGISSPSKDFADEVGNPIVQGIITGIQSTASTLVTAMSNLTGGLVTGAAGAIDQLESAITGAEPPDSEFLGEGILDGIMSGMKGAMPGLMSLVNSTASKVEDAFKGAFDINSPSELMANAIGSPLIQGIIQGMEDTLPDLFGSLNQIALNVLGALDEKLNDETRKRIGSLIDDLTDKAKQVGSSFNDVLASGFGAEGSINRQMAKNLAALSKVDEKARAFASDALESAQKMAAQFADPQTGAKYLKMRSDQIFELAKLQEQIANETDVREKARLQQQMALIVAAQAAEQKAFGADVQGQTSPLQKVIDQINAVMKAADNLSSQSGVDITSNPIIAQLLAYRDQLLNGAGGFDMPTYTPVPVGTAPVGRDNGLGNRGGGNNITNNFVLPPGSDRQTADAVVRALNKQVNGRRS